MTLRASRGSAIETALIVLAAIFVTGCAALDPSYSEGDISFTDQLIGKWRSVGTNPGAGPASGNEGHIEIIERTVPVGDGRLNPKWLGGKGEPAQASTEARAYQVRMSDADHALTLDGYLIRCDGRQFLGLQVSGSLLQQVAPWGWVVPVHHMTLVELEGDRLRLRGLKEPRTWMPLPIGSASDGERYTDAQAALAAVGIYTDIDALVASVRAIGTDDEAWSEWSTFERVATSKR